MHKIVRLVIILGIAFCCAKVNASEYSQELHKIDNLRLADSAEAREKLSAVPAEKLTPEEKEHYDYLSAYFLTFDGDLTAVIEQYKILLNETENPELKIRILGSMINLLGATKDWKIGFQHVEQLLALIQEYPDSPYKADAYINLSHLYYQISQPETALHFVDRVMALPEISPLIRCSAQFLRVRIKIKLKMAVTLSGFREAESACQAANQHYSLLNITIVKARWLVEQERFEEARHVLITAGLLANKTPVEGQLIEIYQLFSRVYLALNQEQKASEYANKVIALPHADSYPGALSSTYDVLRQLAENQHLFKKAYEYLTAKQALDQVLFERQLADEVAIQKAWFEIDAKQSEIELLDKQNDLLKAESQLINERLENSLLALVLLTLLLTSLLFWFYRSRKIQARLKHFAQTDALTQIANRGYFTECMENRLIQAQKNGSVVGLILLDLDHFKNINDSYGHQVGDWSLVNIANKLVETMGKDAIVGRLGGEEFGIVVSGQQGTDVIKEADRCRQAIEHIEPAVAEYQFKLTVSAGVSTTTQTGYKLENLYAAADLALFQSKHYGRNRVYEYSADMHSYS